MTKNKDKSFWNEPCANSDDERLRFIGKYFPKMPTIVGCAILDRIMVDARKYCWDARVDRLSVETAALAIAIDHPEWLTDEEYRTSGKDLRHHALLDKWGWIPITYEDILPHLELLNRVEQMENKAHTMEPVNDPWARWR